MNISEVKAAAARVALSKVKNCINDAEYRAMIRGFLLGYSVLFSQLGENEIASIFEQAHDHMCFGSDDRAINKLMLLLS
jgi:hypothetical protein